MSSLTIDNTNKHANVWSFTVNNTMGMSTNVATKMHMHTIKMMPILGEPDTSAEPFWQSHVSNHHAVGWLFTDACISDICYSHKYPLPFSYCNNLTTVAARFVPLWCRIGPEDGQNKAKWPNIMAHWGFVKNDTKQKKLLENVFPPN